MKAGAWGEKLVWRCHICNDLHFGVEAPEVCPTCRARNAYVRVDTAEALALLGEPAGELNDVGKVISSWKVFCQGSDFGLTRNDEAVANLAKGVLENMRNHGLKYCPCRLTTMDREKDLLLICPCNFKAQRTWEEKGECWCGLFVRREK